MASCENYTPILVADLPVKLRRNVPVTNVTEEFLRSLFSKYGHVIDSPSGVVLKKEKDCEGRPFAFAFVTFETRKEAEDAISNLNYKKIDNCPIRLILADEKTVRDLEKGFNKLLINNLDPKIKIFQLHKCFAEYGNVISCDIATDDVNSLNYGYVQFNRPGETENVMKKLLNKRLCGRPLQLELFKKKQRPRPSYYYFSLDIKDGSHEIGPDETFTKCFIKDLPKSVKTNEDLKGLFENYGKVVSSCIKINSRGESLGYGYCEMSAHEEAVRAVDGLNELKMEDRLLICRRAITIHEKEDLLIKQMDDFLRKYDFSNPTSILVTDLPNKVLQGESANCTNEEYLRSLFSKYGRVINGPSGVIIKQINDWEAYQYKFALVTFESRKDAENAIKKMNYYEINNNPIHLILVDEETSHTLNNCQGCLLIKNLYRYIKVSQLHETFANHGDIIFCEIPTENGTPLGHGIVQFRFPKDAEKAMIDLKDACIEGHPLHIEPYNRPQRIQLEETFKKCCLTNLPKSIKNKNGFNKLFEKYGKVEYSHIKFSTLGENLGYGYCEMSTHEEAVRAVEGLNELKMEDRFLLCSRAMSMHEKRDFLNKQMDDFLRNYQYFEPTPILVADLPIRMLGDYSTNIKTDEFLRSLFSEFGRVIDGPNGVVLKQEKDCDGNSYAFAFVTFGNKIDAESVIKKLNYTKIDNIPIRLILADEETCHVLNSLRSCLIVKNLDPTIEISQIHKAFSNYGDVISCQIPTKKGKPLGYGIVQFRYQEDFERAIADLKDIKIRGRLLKIESYSPEMMVLEKEHCLIKHISDFIKIHDLMNSTFVDIYGFPTEKYDSKYIIDMFSKVSRVDDGPSNILYLNLKSANGRPSTTVSVRFKTRKDAEIAINEFNYTKIDNASIRLEINDEEARSIRRSGVGVLLAKRLNPNIDLYCVHEAFSNYGDIISCEIPTNNGESLGYGIVRFRSPEEAEQAMKDFQNPMINNYPIHIEMPERPRKLRLVETFTKCCIKNIPKSIKTKKDLKRLFDKFGTVVSSRIEFNKNGKGLGYGYCEMRTHEEAVNAVEGIDEYNISGSALHVSFEINELVKKDLKAKQREDKIRIKKKQITSVSRNAQLSLKENIKRKIIDKIFSNKGPLFQRLYELSEEKALQLISDPKLINKWIDSFNLTSQQEENMILASISDTINREQLIFPQNDPFDYPQIEITKLDDIDYLVKNYAKGIDINDIIDHFDEDESSIFILKDLDNSEKMIKNFNFGKFGGVGISVSLYVPKEMKEYYDKQKYIVPNFEKPELPFFQKKMEKYGSVYIVEKVDDENTFSVIFRKRESYQKMKEDYPESYEKYEGRKLYVKNFDEDVTKEDLIDYFKKFGDIESGEIITDLNPVTGASMKFGLICTKTKKTADSCLIGSVLSLFRDRQLFVAKNL